MSPISDTTVLSAMACECTLLAHVKTQASYALYIVVISILLGTIPTGYGDYWPNIAGILLGFVLTIWFMYFMCYLQDGKIRPFHGVVSQVQEG